MKILQWVGDKTACSWYRVYQPLNALAGKIDYNVIPYIPQDMDRIRQLGLVYEIIIQYDLVILQRCPLLNVAYLIRKACDLAGVPMVFETDDDYFHIEEI